MRCGRAIALATLFAAAQAFADTPSWADPLLDWGNYAVSHDALERMRLSVEPEAAFGYANFSDTSTGAFRATGPTSATWFSGGAVLRLALGVRLRWFGVGIEGNWYSVSDAVVYAGAPTVGDSFSASDLAVFERVRLGSPGWRLQISVDLREGTGSFLDNSAPDARTVQLQAFSTLVIGARLNVGWHPFPKTTAGLQVTGYFSVSQWLPQSYCQSLNQGPQTCSSTGLATNTQFMAGLSASWELPVWGPPALRYVLVASRPAPMPEARPPEVLDSPTYRQQLSHFRQVALLAPPGCGAEMPLEPGVSPAEAATERERCRAGMAEIERDLMRQGLKVTSWRTIDSLVREGPLTPPEAALRAGAQVLLQVSSLERLMAEEKTAGTGEVHFFASDPFGSQGVQLELSEPDRAALMRVFEGAPGANLMTTRVGARLELKALLASSGEPIWTYRSSKVDPGLASLGSSMLAQRNSNDDWARDDSTVSAGDSGDAAEAAIAEQASFYRMVREVVAESVRAFAHPGH